MEDFIVLVQHKLETDDRDIFSGVQPAVQGTNGIVKIDLVVFPGGSKYFSLTNDVGMFIQGSPEIG
jgi:hypothetical protein